MAFYLLSAHRRGPFSWSAKTEGPSGQLACSKKPSLTRGPASELGKGYFFSGVAAVAAGALALPYLRRKRSTRPAVSISFCLPVKNGWQAEQISTLMSPRCVDRVVKVLPHAQCTRTS